MVAARFFNNGHGNLSARLHEILASGMVRPHF